MCNLAQIMKWSPSTQVSDIGTHSFLNKHLHEMDSTAIHVIFSKLVQWNVPNFCPIVLTLTYDMCSALLNQAADECINKWTNDGRGYR